MSKIVIICGQAGVGKTTLSTELSKKLNVVCFHKDTIKERLFDLMDGKDREESKRIGLYSLELLNCLAEEAIKNNIDAIVEAPFNHPSNPGLFERWKNELGADIRVIICDLDDNNAEHIRRFRGRERHRAHHGFDRDWQPTPFDYSAMPDLKITLDMSKPLDELIHEALEFIDK